MTMRVRDLIRKLKADGWVLVRVRGSHHHFARSTPGIVTIAYDQESDEIPAGTLNSIFKQAGWK
jgi:predicted RNA binding protein YcfA (HicA-like mRNA interferase family)